MPLEAAFKADYAYLLDAFHTKWPAALVGVNLPWVRGRDADCATLAGWITAVLAPRAAWTFVAMDEAVTIKAGDNGAAYTYDGVHLSEAGITVAANRIKTTMGY